ncbi:MAG: DUF1127 domain-containing protein [Pseudomonadota bacterium]
MPAVADAVSGLEKSREESLASRVAKAVVSFPATLANAQRAASEFEALNALDDRQLADLGIRRDEIGRRILDSYFSGR